MLLNYLIYVFIVLLLAVLLLPFYVKSIINMSLCDSQMLSSYSVLDKFSPISSWPLNNADVGASAVPLPNSHSGKSSYDLQSAPPYLQFCTHIVKGPWIIQYCSSYYWKKSPYKWTCPVQTLVVQRSNGFIFDIFEHFITTIFGDWVQMIFAHNWACF